MFGKSQKISLATRIVIDTAETTAYISMGTFGVAFVDISDLTNPKITNVIPSENGMEFKDLDLDKAQQYLYVSNG